MEKWSRVGSFLTGALVLGIVVLSGPGEVLGQDIDATVNESIGLESSIFGLGVGVHPDYEGSNEYEGVPLLQARLNWERGFYLSFFGNTLKASLLPDRTWHLGPMYRYRMERDDVKDDEVDNMKKVDAAHELGLFGSYTGEHWIAVLQGAKDVAAGHGGALFELGLGYRIPFQEKGSLTLFASSSYADDDYMETYFSVDSADALRSGLSTFGADGGIKDIGAGAAWQYNFNERWGLLTLARYTQLLGDAKDSPVVDDEGSAGQFLAGVMVNYRLAKAKPAVPAKDSDGDGVVDDRDRCPGTPKGVKVDMNGCPLDSDGDGVADDRDKCPGTPKGLLVDKEGCELKLTLHINFDFDKAEIKPEFKPDLDMAAKFVMDHKDVPYIVIAGHTDDVGEEAYNQKLSERRAEAVRQYLIDNYPIDGSKLKAKGFGESQPVADNTTEEGRYQNRRVDILCCAFLPD